MSKYIINIIFLSFFWTTTAQKTVDSLTVTKNDTISYKQPVKIRFGFDIGKFLWAKYQNSQIIDFQIDANFYKDYYLYFNFGHENLLTDNNLLNYNTIGNYYKIGVGYNVYQNWLDMNNDIIVGLGYGHASFDNHLHRYTINQPDAVYPPASFEVDKIFEGQTADWLEFTSQIQVETFKHLFLGYAVNVKYLLYSSDIQDFEVSHIPGFNKKNTFSNFGFGMQYFISYQIKF